MSIRNLKYLFNPGSVAVIGASNTPRRVGTVLMRNLLDAGFTGPVMPVNPRYRSVAGVLAYPDVASLPITPELAVICTPAERIPEALETLGERGTGAAIIISGGLGRSTDPAGNSLQAVVRETARRYGIRLIGPSSLGVLVPGVGLNASFSHVPAARGKIGFVTQSGAFATAVLDWARSRQVGFSNFVSLGESIDVGFDDVLDYLARDDDTQAVLLYIESIEERRRFMSAARAVARVKPVIVLKSGRAADQLRHPLSDVDALVTPDRVYDAAISRAGMLRVFDFNELFSAVETLARTPARIYGDRLAVMTNGGGSGVLAVDRLADLGGRLAALGPATLEKLDAQLPSNWSRGNPVNLLVDAAGKRYADVLEVLLEAEEVDSVLVLHAPTAITSSDEAAEAVIETLSKQKRKRRKYVLTNWLGEEAAEPARERFRVAGVPTYRSPENAASAFMHLVRYRRNQELLIETPRTAPEEFKPVIETARLVIESALASGKTMLGEVASKAVCSSYGIPTVETHVVQSGAAAAKTAQRMGFPVALKVLSDDIYRRSEVGGVVLDLETPEAVVAAAEAIVNRTRAEYPQARIGGFAVQRMARLKQAHELIVGATTDPLFGPVLLFGHGGSAAEVICDRAVGLPPLNMVLAREMIKGTRIYRQLQGYRDQPAVDLDAICLTLIQVSQMVVDLPEIVELDINPLFAGAGGVLALDARIRVAASDANGADRLAIRPYPEELEERYTMKSGRQVLLRPIRPEDEQAHYAFLDRLTPEDLYYRFFGVVSTRMSHRDMARLTQIDYDREMAFIATAPDEQGAAETLGVVRSMTDPDNRVAEFAIVVRSDLKGQGLGRKLLDKMIGYCRARGTAELKGEVMPDNRQMLGMATGFGFQSRHNPVEEVIEVTLPLQQAD